MNNEGIIKALVSTKQFTLSQARKIVTSGDLSKELRRNDFLQSMQELICHCLESDNKKYSLPITSPEIALEQCRFLVGGKDYESFGVLFLNTKHELIKAEIMFKGTINGSAVYPREIAKRALDIGAKAIILTHNHPSDNKTPSQSDISITKKIKDGLSLFDISVLDHIIIAGKSSESLTEKGLI